MTVPSHFTVYAKDRAEFKGFMEKKGVHATSYRPVGPEINLEGHDDAAYIYAHVISLPCDRHYNEEDRLYICDLLKEYDRL